MRKHFVVMIDQAVN